MATQDMIALGVSPDSLSDKELVQMGTALNHRRRLPYLCAFGAGVGAYAFQLSGLGLRTSPALKFTSLFAAIAAFELSGHYMDYQTSVVRRQVEDK
eukprot:NODE_6429_length_511_cov_39.170996_g5653_i0.p1 GENE.NODE_6429_length_511_cov_39.170996_g5653_i0~~NODE_6429_length_511_cov_39.170996_g5653_i0.p1  ORF type:complete len:96 (-),score=13.83 NODE_6429_length_511_cov_39.170996_g5653_i0:193-480(-)